MPTSGRRSESVELTPASTPAHFEHAHQLMLELMAWDCSRVRALGLDWTLAEQVYYTGGDWQLPGKYAPPDGLLLLAMAGTEAAGCGAFSKLSTGICELKRLFVRDAYRGQRIAPRMTSRLIDAAQHAGYRLMRLETVTFMTAALATYRKLGFRECAPYNEIPEGFHEITVCMELDLPSHG